MPAVVKTLEYDPNRSAHIALVQYEDGEKRYIIAPEGLKVGDTVMSGAGADIKPGNCLPFANIPVGTIIHNIELYPGKGAQLVRSAGNMAQLMAKEGKYALASDRPRFRHEPLRPPARRRRGQEPGGPSRPCHPVGQARYGLQDTQTSRAFR